MKAKIQQLQFFFIIFLELLFLPFLYLFEELKKICSSSKPLTQRRKRANVVSKKIYINIHEWGGYASSRKKKIKNGKELTCGLEYQLLRFGSLNNRIEKEIYLTVSDIDLFSDKMQNAKNVNVIKSVSNHGMDFSGYSEFYNLVKEKENAYVILTNTSVNSIQTNFLSDYISYMEGNTDVGMLGVSYSSKIYQSLIKNNFNPHLQSFFLLTTIGVLGEIIAENSKHFPGAGVVYKRLLIKKGEVKISKLVQKAGYNLAVTLEDGSVFKFGKNNAFDNGYKRWKLKNGDVRLTCANPNIINEIKK